MKKFIQNKLKEQKGLTLIELLAVIVILAIIAAIAIPAIGNIIDNSRHNAVKSDVQMVLSSANLYFTEEGSTDGDTATLDGTDNDLTPYVDDAGSVTEATVTKAAGGNTITATAVADGNTYEFSGLTNDDLAALDADGIEALIEE